MSDSRTNPTNAHCKKYIDEFFSQFDETRHSVTLQSADESKLQIQTRLKQRLRDSKPEDIQSDYFKELIQ